MLEADKEAVKERLLARLKAYSGPRPLPLPPGEPLAPLTPEEFSVSLPPPTANDRIQTALDDLQIAHELCLALREELINLLGEDEPGERLSYLHDCVQHAATMVFELLDPEHQAERIYLDQVRGENG